MDDMDGMDNMDSHDWWLSMPSMSSTSSIVAVQCGSVSHGNPFPRQPVSQL